MVYYLWSLSTLLFRYGHSFSVPRKALAGLWKLNIIDDYSDSFALLNSATDDSTVVLRILEDGTFQQCNEDDNDRSFNTWRGLWDFQEDSSKIQLALDRDCALQDVLFQGKLCRSSDVEGEQTTGCLQIQQGQVSAGKFMYPSNHRNFFDQPLATSETVGRFEAHQVMGFATFLNEPEELETPPLQFAKSDFYDRSFFLTVTPIRSKVQRTGSAAADDEIRNLPVDIRAMRIEFHSNNTFTCWATNKILRGKFEITDDDALYFHVSRFGAGKSAPGSVYSEGIGLSHEDERTYVGSITRHDSNDEAGLQVQGTVLFGADLGSDARPEPVGTFLLREVHGGTSSPLDSMNEDTDEEERDLFDSVFE
eukprot:scaffold2363_cov159-Amphora_coffeaeformis.AAC.4